MKLPEGHQHVMPYFILPDAFKFLDFLKSVFNATEVHVYKNEDGSIMHAEAMIGKSTVMFGNSSGQWKPQTASIYVYVENVDDTFRKALEKGAKTLMEIEDKDYGRSGGIEDPFGNVWWLVEAGK